VTLTNTVAIHFGVRASGCRPFTFTISRITHWKTLYKAALITVALKQKKKKEKSKMPNIDSCAKFLLALL